MDLDITPLKTRRECYTLKRWRNSINECDLIKYSTAKDKQKRSTIQAVKNLCSKYSIEIKAIKTLKTEQIDKITKNLWIQKITSNEHRKSNEALLTISVI